MADTCIPIRAHAGLRIQEMHSTPAAARSEKIASGDWQVAVCVCRLWVGDGLLNTLLVVVGWVSVSFYKESCSGRSYYRIPVTPGL